jgi:hypothetical protein
LPALAPAAVGTAENREDHGGDRSTVVSREVYHYQGILFKIHRVEFCLIICSNIKSFVHFTSK